MLTIEYSSYGSSHSDFGIEEWLLERCNNLEESLTYMNTSTENLIQAALTLVAEGKIDCQFIQFAFEGGIIHVNKYGVPNKYPNGFTDTYGNLLERRLLAALEMHKKTETKYLANVLSKAFVITVSSAVYQIKQGNIYVNGEKVTEINFKVKAGDKVETIPGYATKALTTFIME